MYNKALELALEELLEKAFEQVSYRPYFLKNLLDSFIYILIEQEETHDDHAESVIIDEKEIQIKGWKKKDGTIFFPFFTSLEKLQKTIRNNENYLRINTRSFLERIVGKHVVLNPYSEMAKEFVPEEISGLLNGDFNLHRNSNEPMIQPQDEFSYPSPYPIHMVEQIKILLQVKHAVASAYIVQKPDEKHITKTSLVIGILLSQVLSDLEKQRLARQLRQTAFDSLIKKKKVNLIIFESNDQSELVQFFLHKTQPFYLRQDEKKKGFFATLFA